MHLTLHELYYNLGHVLHQQGDLTGAADSYRRSLALQPDYVNAHQNLGVVLDEQGQRSAAIDCYRQAIALNPNQIRAYNNLGCVLLKQGQNDEAIEVYYQAIARQPRWATLYSNLGQALLAQGNAEGAMAAYRHAIKLQPEWASSHHYLGNVWQRVGQHANAIACFQQALYLEPTLTEVYSDWAVSSLALGKLEQAMDCLHHAIAPHALFIDFYCTWADRLTSQDELAQAKQACSRFLRSLQHSAQHPDLYSALGHTYTHLANVLTAYGGIQQYRQAETLYQKALQLLPNNINLYQHLGNCLRHQGRLDAAILVYHTALAIQPNHPQIQFELAKTLETHCPEDAIAYYQTLLHLSTPQLHCPTSSSPPSSPPRSAPPPPCSGLNCSPCLQKILTSFKPIQIAKKVYFCSDHHAGIIEPQPTVVTTLPHGRAWVVPQQNEWMVCNAIAILTANNTLVAEVSRSYPGTLPGCAAASVSHDTFSIETLPPPELIDGSIAVLAGLSGNTYFHWMVDILPRVDVLHRHGIEIADIDWVLVNSNSHPFQRETLAMLGISADQIVQSDRHPHIQATQLVVPSFPGHVGWLQPWALEFLRRTFLPVGADLSAEISRSSNLPERIYISRAHARYRRVFNEPDVINLLGRFGFVPIVLESLSFKQQVALFAHAKAIVAPHGGGLTNTVFCQPQTTVVELVSPHYIRHYYWVISSLLGLNHYYVSGQPFSCHPIRELMYPNPLTEDILIDLNSIERLMKLTGLAD